MGKMAKKLRAESKNKIIRHFLQDTYSTEGEVLADMTFRVAQAVYRSLLSDAQVEQIKALHGVREKEEKERLRAMSDVEILFTPFKGNNIYEVDGISVTAADKQHYFGNTVRLSLPEDSFIRVLKFYVDKAGKDDDAEKIPTRSMPGHNFFDFIEFKGKKYNAKSGLWFSSSSKMQSDFFKIEEGTELFKSVSACAYKVEHFWDKLLEKYCQVWLGLQNVDTPMQLKEQMPDVYETVGRHFRGVW